jgi:hypothetical protein
MWLKVPSIVGIAALAAVTSANKNVGGSSTLGSMLA